MHEYLVQSIISVYSFAIAAFAIVATNNSDRHLMFKAIL